MYTRWVLSSTRFRCPSMHWHPHMGTPSQGLREFLDWVAARGLRRAAVTNAPRANAEMMLTALGLDGYFEVCGDVVGGGGIVGMWGKSDGGNVVGWMGGSST